jgi:hypothetical protein
VTNLPPMPVELVDNVHLPKEIEYTKELITQLKMKMNVKSASYVTPISLLLYIEPTRKPNNLDIRQNDIIEKPARIRQVITY